jgi:SagB-type dehydrogenase family enzyme
MENDNKKYQELLEERRYFLKDSIRKTIDFSKTDQSQGIAAPPVEKPHKSESEKINLPLLDWNEKYDHNIINAIKNRNSRRKYKNEPLFLEELSFLLWATQGAKFAAGSNVFRNVPSAGCRHALETYLAIFNVDELEKGIYRYLPLTHQLLMEFPEENLKQKIIKGTFNQNFAGEGALTFIWTAVPYRMEWRYGLAAHKVIALDAGHVGQNLYLSCEVIDAGTCAIAAYDQEYMDDLLRIDGKEEFTIYIAPVGKK